MDTNTEVLQQMAFYLKWMAYATTFIAVCVIVPTVNSIRYLINDWRSSCGGAFTSVYRKAYTLMEGQRHEGALRLLEKHIGKHPEDAYSYCLAGRAHYRLGRKEKALELMRKANELDPSMMRYTEHYLKGDEGAEP